MLKARKKIKRISASAKCFRVFALCVLFFAISINPCHALSVSGIPDWLKPAVIRSLNAVWSEIPNSPEIDREGTLRIVASRLFSGYDINIKSNNEEPEIFFTANYENGKIIPDIKLITPELRGMASKWFEDDISGIDEQIFELVKNLPQNSFTWADEALKEKFTEIINEKLPGWEFSQQIFISQTSTLININFRPSSKMILAINPELYSRTLPVMIKSDLSAKLIPAFSPLIGIPVEWAEKHKSDIEKTAREFLEDRNSVENLHADVNVNFIPDTISNLEARVDSKNFMFQMWVAAYAGIEDRYPEIGTFFGYRTNTGFNAEIYAEVILSLNDFNVVHRIGGRFESIDKLWFGIENQWPDNKYFFRVQYMPLKIRRPYAWWRFSPELEAHEAALGYRIDDHMSLEIYYYNKGEDKLGLRGMWHL